MKTDVYLLYRQATECGLLFLGGQIENNFLILIRGADKWFILLANMFFFVKLEGNGL